MNKESGIAKGLLTGLLGIGDITAENIARQAGKGVRRSAAPVAAAGGTAAVLKKKEKKEHQQAMTKEAFWNGFYKAATSVIGVSPGIRSGVKAMAKPGVTAPPLAAKPNVSTAGAVKAPPLPTGQAAGPGALPKAPPANKQKAQGAPGAYR